MAKGSQRVRFSDGTTDNFALVDTNPIFTNLSDGTDQLDINADGSINASIVAGGTVASDLDVSSALAAAASDTHTVVASGVYKIKQIILSSVDDATYEIKIGPNLSTVAVAYAQTSAATKTVVLNLEGLEVPDTEQIEVVKTNTDNKTQDQVTSTIVYCS